MSRLKSSLILNPCFQLGVAGPGSFHYLVIPVSNREINGVFTAEPVSCIYICRHLPERIGKTGVVCTTCRRSLISVLIDSGIDTHRK